MKKLNSLIGEGFLCAAFLMGAAAHAQDIKIGAIFPLSGPNASYGDLFSSGANLAVEHVNADQMLKGKLSIVFEDSQALPQRGVIAMNKLVNVDKVPYVLSAFTGVSKAISAIGQRTRTVSVNGGGVGPDLAELGPYFWNVIPLANFEVRAIVPHMVKVRGLKRVALIYVDDPLGQSVRKELEAALPASGGTLTEALSVPASLQQFGGIAAKVRETRSDAIYLASYGSQQYQLIKQLRDNGVTQPIASYSSFSVPEIQTSPEAKGSLYTSQHIDWNSNDPATRRFFDDYKKKYGKAPSSYAANYYNAVRLFAQLAANLQKQGKPLSGENLQAGRMAARTFDFVGGKVSFEPNGTVATPIQINEMDGVGVGKQVEIVPAK